MADENDDIPQAVAERKEGTKDKSSLVTLLLLVNTLMMGAIAYFQFSYHQEQKNKADIRDLIQAEMMASKENESIEGEVQTPSRSDGKLMNLEPFTSNLAQGDGPRRYLRLNTVLKFSMDSKEEEFRAREPQIRDTIISILNSKRPEDLLMSEGKNFLKEEIKSALNSFLVDGKIIDVFYVSFQIN